MNNCGATIFAVLDCFITRYFTLWRTLALSPDNDLNLFCLHFVYTPLINKALETFKRLWNHKLSSEANATPQQLYIRGMLQRLGTDDPVG